MAPGGQPLRLGPFTGALNTASDPTAIADAELAELVNFELDIDGSLISRTPMQEIQGYRDWDERILCIGEGIFDGDHYLIASNVNGVYYYLDGTWAVITTTFQASVAVQFANKIYLVPKPGSGSGGKWDPVGGFTAVAAIPKGQAAVVHKERLFVCPGVDALTNTSRLIFSEPGDFDTWDASDFIDIGQGDGTNLIDVTVYQDNLLLFKNQSAYVLSYDVRPADAVVRKISLTIGAENQFNVVNYENQVYLFHNGWVYEIINYDFNRLNTKVPFIRDETTPSPFSDESVFLSIVEDKLICRFYAKVYVYGLRTRTWSEWVAEDDIETGSKSLLNFFGPVHSIRKPTGTEYYAGTCISAYRSLIKIIAKHTVTDKEHSFGSAVTISDTFTRVVVDGWGDTETGGETWATSGGSSADYDVNGTEATHAITSINVSRLSSLSSPSADIDQVVKVKTGALASGASQFAGIVARYLDVSNNYRCTVEFTTAAEVKISLLKTVSGSVTTLASLTTALTHTANTYYSVRFRIHGSNLFARVWLSSTSEPVPWSIEAADTDLTSSNLIGLRSLVALGNTNTLPLVFTYDDYSVVDLSTRDREIRCFIRTKNYDMAVSHQFKRLWWWGADVLTMNDILGIATPVIVIFSIKWGTLNGRKWGSLTGHKWGQLLSTPNTVNTTVPSNGVNQKKFVKFNKGLRYRQINFAVRLITNGSTSDGPARLFTMIAITETRQAVPKSIN